MSELLTERAGATLTLTLNRPDKMNALSASLVDALQAAVDEAARGEVRLLVLRGSGRNFSAGFDFGGVEAQSEGDLLLRFVRIEQLLQSLSWLETSYRGSWHPNIDESKRALMELYRRMGNAEAVDRYRVPPGRFYPH